MTQYRTLTVTVSAALAEALEAAVASGDYPTTGEIIREALGGWQRQRRLRAEEIAELRRLIHEGLESGPAVEVTDAWFEDIKRRGRERLGLPTD